MCSEFAPREGDPPDDGFLLLLSGRVAVLKRSADGGDLLLESRVGLQLHRERKAFGKR